MNLAHQSGIRLFEFCPLMLVRLPQLLVPVAFESLHHGAHGVFCRKSQYLSLLKKDFQVECLFPTFRNFAEIDHSIQSSNIAIEGAAGEIASRRLFSVGWDERREMVEQQLCVPNSSQQLVLLRSALSCRWEGQIPVDRLVDEVVRLMAAGANMVILEDGSGALTARTTQNTLKTLVAAGITLNEVMLLLRDVDRYNSCRSFFQAIEAGITNFVVCSGSFDNILDMHTALQWIYSTDTSGIVEEQQRQLAALKRLSDRLQKIEKM